MSEDKGVNDWRSRLTADEAKQVAVLDNRLENLSKLRRTTQLERRAIYLRAKKRSSRLQIVVDKDMATA